VEPRDPSLSLARQAGPHLHGRARLPGEDARDNGIPHGIVAYADLSSPDVGRLLAAHAEHRNVRGIRQILNVHPDPLYDYVGRHFMREPAWRKGFGLLRWHGLSFDLQIYPAQAAEAAEVARENPETAIILDHTGMFVDRSAVAGWRAWREGLRTLAACPNVSVKISGLGVFDHRWTVESLRPYVLEAIDAFGVERSMFASNFPVDRLYGTYEALWHAYAEIVGGASEAEQAALFRENAQRVHRLQVPTRAVHEHTPAMKDER
jgi:predicted TIM-barrel fold metal-dependent hydrolase